MARKTKSPKQEELDSINYCITALERCIDLLRAELSSKIDLSPSRQEKAIKILLKSLDRIEKEKEKKFPPSYPKQRNLLKSSAGWIELGNSFG